MSPQKLTISWTEDDVVAWILTLDTSCMKFAHLFKENNVNGKHLLKMTDARLEKIGVTSLGAREDLLEGIDILLFRDSMKATKSMDKVGALRPTDSTTRQLRSMSVGAYSPKSRNRSNRRGSDDDLTDRSFSTTIDLVSKLKQLVSENVASRSNISRSSSTVVFSKISVPHEFMKNVDLIWKEIMQLVRIVQDNGPKESIVSGTMSTVKSTSVVIRAIDTMENSSGLLKMRSAMLAAVSSLAAHTKCVCAGHTTLEVRQQLLDVIINMAQLLRNITLAVVVDVTLNPSIASSSDNPRQEVDEVIESTDLVALVASQERSLSEKKKWVSTKPKTRFELTSIEFQICTVVTSFVSSVEDLNMNLRSLHPSVFVRKVIGVLASINELLQNADSIYFDKSPPFRARVWEFSLELINCCKLVCNDKLANARVNSVNSITALCKSLEAMLEAVFKKSCLQREVRFENFARLNENTDFERWKKEGDVAPDLTVTKDLKQSVDEINLTAILVRGDSKNDFYQLKWGEELKLKALTTEGVDELKDKVFHAIEKKIPRDRISISFNGSTLLSGSTLKDYLITESSNLFVFPSPETAKEAVHCVTTSVDVGVSRDRKSSVASTSNKTIASVNTTAMARVQSLTKELCELEKKKGTIHLQLKEAHSKVKKHLKEEINVINENIEHVKMWLGTYKSSHEEPKRPSGWVYIAKKKNGKVGDFKKEFAVLFNEVRMWDGNSPIRAATMKLYKESPKLTKSAQLLHTVDLRNVSIEIARNYTKRKFCFLITNARNSEEATDYMLSAESEFDMFTWIRALQYVGSYNCNDVGQIAESTTIFDDSENIVRSKAVAISDYSATSQSDRLSFRIGDVIAVTSQEGNLWKGKCRGGNGEFPASHVESISKEDVELLKRVAQLS